MNPLDAAQIQGTYATVLLPIGPHDEIDLGRLDAEMDALITSGVDGIYSNGTAGEFWSLSEGEFAEVNSRLAERCEQARVPFQIGASFPSPQVSLARARLAAEFQPGAIQIILPDWYPPSLDESIAFLERVAEAVQPVPLVLYNPPHAKRVLSPAEFVVLSNRVPTLAGIKVGAGDPAWYEQMRPLAGRLSIFVPGHSLASGYSLGASGSYSNVACLQPAGAKRWYELMRNNPDAALAVEAQIQRFLQEHVIPFRERLGFSNMALDKLLAFAGDWAPVGTRLRWPYLGIDEVEAQHVRVLARRSVPFLFDGL